MTVSASSATRFAAGPSVVTGLTEQIRLEAFEGEPALLIGTGGLSVLFENDGVFDKLLPDLVLVGLRHALSLNPDGSQKWLG